MLVLSRRLKEKILIPAIHASIEVVAVKPGVVRLGITAPPEITILREEVQDRTAEWGAVGKESASGSDATLRQLQQLLHKRLLIAGKGLAQARSRLKEGCVEDVHCILDHLEEDLLMLDDRVDQTPAHAPSPAAKPRRALLVEDDQNERELLAGLLRMSGVEVDTAGDGLDALQHLRSQDRPDVVLLDMGLPRCDGPTMVRNIRRDPAYAGLKICAVTGSAPDQFHLDQGARGVDRWFSKPLDYEALLRYLDQDLDIPITCR